MAGTMDVVLRKGFGIWVQGNDYRQCKGRVMVTYLCFAFETSTGNRNLVDSQTVCISVTLQEKATSEKVTLWCDVTS